MKLFAVTVAMLAACGSTSAPRATTGSRQQGQPHACPSETARGRPEDYVSPQLPAGVTVDAPQMCAHGEAYLRITRASGARRLGTKRGPSGGFGEGCTELPADPNDGTCPVINAVAVMNAVRQKLAAMRFEAGGPGLGPCGDSQGDFDAWHMSIHVYQWQDAAVAVQRLALLLDRYDLQGTVGVAVVGIPCVELL